MKIKNILIFSCILLILLLIVGCSKTPKGLNSEQEKKFNTCYDSIDEKKVEIDGYDDPITKVDFCINKVAQNSMKSRLCEKISNSYLKDDCYYRFGIGMKDKKICNKISDGATKYNCNLIAGLKPLKESDLTAYQDVDT